MFAFEKMIKWIKNWVNRIFIETCFPNAYKGDFRIDIPRSTKLFQPSYLLFWLIIQSRFKEYSVHDCHDFFEK